MADCCWFSLEPRSPLYCIASKRWPGRVKAKYYAHLAIPVVRDYTFETLLVAFLLLVAGNMFRGL